MTAGRLFAGGLAAAALWLPAAPAAAACESASVLNLDGMWVQACAGTGGVTVCSGREEIGCDA